VLRQPAILLVQVGVLGQHRPVADRRGRRRRATASAAAWNTAACRSGAGG
jgi:hypothetical protein